jgi:rhamnose utilization protein RhaD (predicted bifunctional aldolase and dehydrogenase)
VPGSTLKTPQVDSIFVTTSGDVMSVRDEVTEYSARVGNDPLLIQGAGGNISWKDGAALWIKASGTWLSEAQEKDIFVPMDLACTLELIEADASDLKAACIDASALRPSIETALHALLPHRVVAHFHAVEVIAFAVRTGARELLKGKLTGLNWAWVDYVKPGSDLARAVVATMQSKDKVPDILVLGNHGLVVAADSVQEVNRLLQEVVARCQGTERVISLPSEIDLSQLAFNAQGTGYNLPKNPKCHLLGTDAICLAVARKAWVLYPDHAVFLGGRSVILEDWPTCFEDYAAKRPECIIIAHKGVLIRDDLTTGQIAMLDCYAEVVLRLHDSAQIAPLTDEQIGALLNWDAEKYRQNLNAL